MTEAQARPAALRWGLSFGLAVAGHAAVAAMLLWPRPEVVPAAALAPAVIIDLAPLPVAAPPQPQPEPVVEPIPEPTPEPIPTPRKKPVEQPVPRREPPPVAAPSPAAAPRPQPAPAVAARPAVPSHLMPTWHSVLAAHLERHKRYPRAAVVRRQQGVVHLRFTINRAGNVLAQGIARSSGVAALDEEALRMVARAQPFPQPPAELPGARFEFEVPVQFALR